VLQVFDLERRRLTSHKQRQAAALLDELGEAELVSASTPDGTSARVTVRLRWRPPVLSLFVPDGVGMDATATTRTALG